MSAGLPDAPELPDLDEVPPMLTCDRDGTHHYSQLKHLDDSGKQYIHACNHPIVPTRMMLLGTGLHLKTLGPRPGGKRVVVFDGDRRSGNDWKYFKAANADAEILTAPEWELVEEIHAALSVDPVAQGYLEGARFEVPMTWDEGGILCSTSGIDIVVNSMIGDLKLTSSTRIDDWTRQAFKMKYPQQLAFYRRGARANGIDTSKGLFLLGIEAKAPYEVVALELTENMIDFADRSVSLWLGKLRSYKQANQWPGRAQCPIPFELPAYVDHDEEDNDEEDDEAA